MNIHGFVIKGDYRFMGNDDWTAELQVEDENH